MDNTELGLFCASPAATVVEALHKIDINSKGILFVTNETGVLVGCLTDGDVRRWLVGGGNLQSPIAQVMNTTPKFVTEWDRGKVSDLMARHLLVAVPVCDGDHRIVDVIFKDVGSKKNAAGNTVLSCVPVVIMAGGKGTRLYPYTKILPKPLMPIGDLPIAEHIINRFHEFGCNTYYMIVNHKKNMIKAYFNELEKDYTLHYIDESTPLGTGGGLSLLKGLDGTFILSNCDVLIDEDFGKIYNHHKTQKNAVTMVCSLKNYNIPYGIVHFSKGGAIETLEEKPTVSFFTNTGCYFVEPEVLPVIPEATPIGFPEIIERCKARGMRVGVYPISEESWLDMGQFDTMEDMRKRIEKGYQ